MPQEVTGPRDGRTYFLSLLLHGAVVAAILIVAYAANQTSPQAAPKIFELVAGTGNNYGATAAPALGVPGGVKLTMPATRPVPVAPAETAPAPPPPQPAAPAPSVPNETLARSATPDASTPNFTKTLERTENRRAAKLEAQYKKQLEAEQRKQMSYDEYVKQHGAPKAGAAPAASSKVEKVDAEGIRDGVVGGSAANKTGGAGGNALTREEGDLLDAYFAFLTAKIKENDVPPSGVSDRLETKVSFYVAADGSLSRGHITQSSGNAAFDQSVLEAIARTHSVGPRPDHRGDTETLTFKIKDEGE